MKNTETESSSIKSSKRGWVSTIALVVFGVLLWGGFNTAMEETNTLSFCISCHEMQSTVYQEYKHSVHATNPSGVRAACPDCHVPKEWGPKVLRKIQASMEVYHWLVGSIDSKEKFEARRGYLANRVWDTMQKTDSRECRNCHEFGSMELAGQARFAARIHEDGINQGNTCIDCHKGIAHQLPLVAQVEKAAPNNDDLDYGEEINETCAGCHGEKGQGSQDGEYPRIAGMSEIYLTNQLNHFKTRDRLNIPMVPYTNERELPAEDIQAVVAYLASIELPTKLEVLEEDAIKDESFNALGRLQDSMTIMNIAKHPGNIDAGSRNYKRECATCHGKQAQGSEDGLTPPLRGQHIAYLKRQLISFKKAERVHTDPRDAEIFKQFGDNEIDDIMAFLSVQDD